MKKIQLVGEVSDRFKVILTDVFHKHGLSAELESIDKVSSEVVISLSKEATKELENRKVKFFNWDLLFTVLGPNDSGGEIENKITERIKVLEAIKNLKMPSADLEFHGSIRVKELASSARFYTWLFGIEPKEWTHRYVTFHRIDAKFNFVLLVSDGKELNHDTLYHLGVGVESKNRVIEFYHSAKENGFHIEKPPRTTWRGTPLHEMWLKDPDGTLIEIYSRLTEEELKLMPEDKEPFELT
jgi:catechol 2,3-dioxygenase-like lactoylglutathione lyase family enzyme